MPIGTTESTPQRSSVSVTQRVVRNRTSHLLAFRDCGFSPFGLSQNSGRRGTLVAGMATCNRSGRAPHWQVVSLGDVGSQWGFWRCPAGAGNRKDLERYLFREIRFAMPWDVESETSTDGRPWAPSAGHHRVIHCPEVNPPDLSSIPLSPEKCTHIQDACQADRRSTFEHFASTCNHSEPMRISGFSHRIIPERDWHARKDSLNSRPAVVGEGGPREKPHRLQTQCGERLAREFLCGPPLVELQV